MGAKEVLPVASIAHIAFSSPKYCDFNIHADRYAETVRSRLYCNRTFE